MNPTGARHFHEELADLKAKLLETSSLAEELVSTAVRALRERDLALAEAVIAGDRELDALEVEVDDTCIHLLALQQPMARDLRLITMAMKICNDLERVGDHAVNIAQTVKHLSDLPNFNRLPEIDEMARVASEMLSDALDHFVRGDSEAAREVCARDDTVDALHHSTFRILVTHMMEDPRSIGPAMNWFLVSSNLERIADLATNIAEDVVYLVEGTIIRHGARRITGMADGGQERCVGAPELPARPLTIPAPPFATPSLPPPFPRRTMAGKFAPEAGEAFSPCELRDAARGWWPRRSWRS